MRKESGWEPPHLCGGRGALAHRERAPGLITRFSAGNARAWLHTWVRNWNSVEPRRDG